VALNASPTTGAIDSVRIEVGKLADFIVIDRNIFEVPN